VNANVGFVVALAPERPAATAIAPLATAAAARVSILGMGPALLVCVYFAVCLSREQQTVRVVAGNTVRERQREKEREKERESSTLGLSQELLVVGLRGGG
jgi:hypothetical protein